MDWQGPIYTLSSNNSNRPEGLIWDESNEMGVQALLCESTHPAMHRNHSSAALRLTVDRIEPIASDVAYLATPRYSGPTLPFLIRSIIQLLYFFAARNFRNRIPSGARPRPEGERRIAPRLGSIS